MSEITVLRDDVEWRTRLDGEISGVEVNGQKLSDIHDLTQKVIVMTKTLKVIAITATLLALTAVIVAGSLGGWLFDNYDEIQFHLQDSHKVTHSNFVMSEKLDSIGWQWQDGGWVNLED